MKAVNESHESWAQVWLHTHLSAGARRTLLAIQDAPKEFFGEDYLGHQTILRVIKVEWKGAHVQKSHSSFLALVTWRETSFATTKDGGRVLTGGENQPRELISSMAISCNPPKVPFFVRKLVLSLYSGENILFSDRRNCTLTKSTARHLIKINGFAGTSASKYAFTRLIQFQESLMI